MAGFWIRWVAHVIDSLLLTAVSWFLELVCLGAVYWLGRVLHSGDQLTFSEAFTSFTLQVLNFFLYLALALPYYAVGLHRYGTTLGKRVFGIRVVDAISLGPLSMGQAVGRCFGYVLSYVIFFGGFLMAAFHPRKQSLHDLLAGTVSIRVLLIVVSGALLLGNGAIAGEGPGMQLTGSYVRLNPQANGGELGGALLFEPFPDRFVMAGPRLSVVGARTSDGRDRWDLNTGAEGVLWLGNLLGAGLGLDFVGPSLFEGRSTPHLRIDPFFSVRFKRLKEKGAWAFRVSLPYSTQHQWGLKLGLVLQFGGVPVAWD